MMELNCIFGDGGGSVSWGCYSDGGIMKAEEKGGIYTNTGEKTPAGEGGYTNLIRDRVVPET